MLSGAIVAFSARGHHAARMAEISSESGIDSRSVCAFFPAKYELFCGIVRAAVIRLFCSRGYNAVTSFLVFAGLSVVADLGRVTKWQQDETTMVKIAKLVLCAMTTTR